MKHLKGNQPRDCYLVPATRIPGDGGIPKSDMEVLDCLLLAIDNFVTGNLQTVKAQYYVGQRLGELTDALKRGC